VDVEKRLLDDAASFAEEVTSLDEEGFISRTLAYLGIPAEDSDTIPDRELGTLEARPRPAAGPARGHRSRSLREETPEGAAQPSQAEIRAPGPAEANPATPRLSAAQVRQLHGDGAGARGQTGPWFLGRGGNTG